MTDIHTAEATAARIPSRPHRALNMVRSVLLSIAAAGGIVCIVLVILAFTLHITLIMFRTGSMAPQMPTGSLAVVKQIPAAHARIGDVVTVDRPHQLPVTHRVVSITPQADGRTQLRLKGDANPEPDIQPYAVRTVRRVIWSAPGLAYVIVWFSQPVVIGSLTLAVALLVSWSLWPQAERATRAEDPDDPPSEEPK
jgi:signal peptidase I